MRRRACSMLLVMAAATGCGRSASPTPASTGAAARLEVEVAYALCARVETCHLPGAAEGMPRCMASYLEALREPGCRDFQAHCPAEVETMPCEDKAMGPASCGTCIAGLVRHPGVRVVD